MTKPMTIIKDILYHKTTVTQQPYTFLWSTGQLPADAEKLQL